MRSDRSILYLDAIAKYCQDIIDLQNEYGKTFDAFLNNKGYQYSVSFCIEQIGEFAKKLREKGFAEKYPDVKWNEISGLRNRIAHSYDSIDLDMVFDISVDDIPQLFRDCKDMLRQEERKLAGGSRPSMNGWNAVVKSMREDKPKSVDGKEKEKSVERDK